MILSEDEKRTRLRKRAEGVRNKYGEQEAFSLGNGELDSLLLACEVLAYLDNNYYGDEND